MFLFEMTQGNIDTTYIHSDDWLWLKAKQSIEGNSSDGRMSKNEQTSTVIKLMFNYRVSKKPWKFSQCYKFFDLSKTYFL